ncbi:MAG TPA: 2-oxoglutarate and iron-dependent oxygenase domain-containing protein [Bauldia sp.]|nr:2-oxoglutarate and iron-dependent oxygenase domain-containing protein [Bauldia sp.]
MTTSLPVIDMSAKAATLAEEIGKAARGVGFFYVSGHGVSPALMADVFAESKQFFALPVETKERVSIRKSPHNRGYVGMKGESLDPTKAPDLKEAYNVGLELAADDPRVVRGEPFRGVNLWPDVPGWRETMLTYFDAVWSVGRRLHEGIARDMQLPADYFEDKLDSPMATLRLLHYPPQPAGAAAGQIGAGEHTDYGDITLLLTDEVGGLEVKRRDTSAKDGGWIAAPHVPGAFICNIGDCLMRWTNDVYVSTPHRVVNRGGRERYSVAFFLDPNPDATVQCLPTCVSTERPAKYPPISGAAYLRSRLDATYGKMG